MDWPKCYLSSTSTAGCKVRFQGGKMHQNIDQILAACQSLLLLKRTRRCSDTGDERFCTAVFVGTNTVPSYLPCNRLKRWRGINWLDKPRISLFWWTGSWPSCSGSVVNPPTKTKKYESIRFGVYLLYCCKTLLKLIEFRYEDSLKMF